MELEIFIAVGHVSINWVWECMQKLNHWFYDRKWNFFDMRFHFNFRVTLTELWSRMFWGIVWCICLWLQKAWTYISLMRKFLSFNFSRGDFYQSQLCLQVSEENSVVPKTPKNVYFDVYQQNLRVFFKWLREIFITNEIYGSKGCFTPSLSYKRSNCENKRSNLSIVFSSESKGFKLSMVCMFLWKEISFEDLVERIPIILMNVWQSLITNIGCVSELFI